MKAIESNPFGVLALPINATVREIEKRTTELETFASMGKSKSYDLDFSFLPVERTPEKIADARKKLQLDEDRFRHSLFWFWNNNSIDDLALDLLRDGNVDKAVAIWEKAIFANSKVVYKKVPVINDLIAESNSWPTLDNDDHRLGKQGGEYTIVRKNDEKFSIPVVPVEFGDQPTWSVECDIEWISVEWSSDEQFYDGYGIVLGRQNDSYLSFEISADGYYRYGKTEKWQYEDITGWTECDSIETYDSNHIALERDNDELRLIINGDPIETIPNQPFFGKHFGFIVRDKQEISFRNFKFSEFRRDDRYAVGASLSSKNFSCAKNLALLYLTQCNPHEILKWDAFDKALRLSELVLLSDLLDEYANNVCGERFVLDRNVTVDYFTREVIESFRSSLDKPYGVKTSTFIKGFSTFPDKTFQKVKDRFVGSRIRDLSKSVELASEKRRTDVRLALDAGKSLITDTEENLKYLKTALGSESVEYQIASDKVANEIVDCAVGHVNESGAHESALPLFEYGISVAVTPKTIDRANENLELCRVFIQVGQIRQVIDKAQNACLINPVDGITAGRTLISASKEPLSKLKSIAGEKSEPYINAADHLSHQVIQCAIASFNATRKDEAGLPLYEFAASIATTPEGIKYAKENLTSCQEWIKNKAYLLCHFCAKNEPKMAASITTTMYLETNRSYFPTRSVAFSYGDVFVPRCEECESIHTAVSSYHMKTAFTIIASAAVGGVIGAVLSSNLMPSSLSAADREQKSLVFGAVCALILGIVGWGITYKFFTKVDAGDIRKASDIGSYPPIQKRLSEGWSFSKPSA